MTTASAERPVIHTWAEDVQGLFFGVVLTAFGAVLLQSAGLITGQLAGLSILTSRAFHVPFGLVFFLLNVPFYGFALAKRGWTFTLRTLIAVTLISLLIQYMPSVFRFEQIDPWAAAILAGLCSGIGLISLFRHGASAGGIGILALYIQDRTGFRAGWTQLGFDAGVFLIGALILPLPALFASLLGAVVLNIGIAVNHRRDRYIGVTR